jgi:hypothetical protein
MNIRQMQNQQKTKVIKDVINLNKLPSTNKKNNKRLIRKMVMYRKIRKKVNNLIIKTNEPFC